MVEPILLPVTFNDAYKVLEKKINEFNPDVILCFGLGAGRDSIELETRAENKINATMPDNLGQQPFETPITENGPEFYFSTLPLQGLEGALQKRNIPVKTSNSAGNFVCNYVFYKLMESNQDTERLCGFIHVPLLPDQAKDGEPSLSLETLFEAVSAMLTYINY